MSSPIPMLKAKFGEPIKPQLKVENGKLVSIASGLPAVLNPKMEGFEVVVIDAKELQKIMNDAWMARNWAA